MSAGVSISLRRMVIVRAQGLCEYCLIHQSDTAFSFQVDHIISRKQRGPTTAGNLALACLRCNVAKGADPGAWIGRPPRLVWLYHSRQDAWRDHFRPAGARITPLTDEGTATVRLLDLNGSDRLLLRRALIKAGRYPSLGALVRLRD